MPGGDSGRSLVGTVLGGFRLVEKIGEGGMGAVYKGYDESLDRHVAVKILPQALAADETYVRRFMREARSVAKLHHPNLVHIYAVGEEGGLHYFAMEMIAGEPLVERIAREGGLGVIDSVRVIGQTMSALGKVHALGIIHRDIKSANIMLTPDGRAILMDFGLAKGGEYAEGVTSAGIVLGTPEYMAPEQALGEEITPQVDVYSLGVLLFEMVTGKLPFTGKTAIAVIRQHTETEPPVPSSLMSGIPKALEGVILPAMAKDRAVRYRDLSQMAGALLHVGRTRELVDLAGSGPDAPAAPKVPRKTMERSPHVPAKGTAQTLVDSAPSAPSAPTILDDAAKVATGAPTIADELPAAPAAPAAAGEKTSFASVAAVVFAGLSALAIFLAVLWSFWPAPEIEPVEPVGPGAGSPAAEVRIGGEAPFTGRLVSITREGDSWIAVIADESGELREVNVRDLKELEFSREPEGPPGDGDADDE